MDQIQKLKELITLLVAEDGIELYDVARAYRRAVCAFCRCRLCIRTAVWILIPVLHSLKNQRDADELDMIASEYFLEQACSPAQSGIEKRTDQGCHRRICICEAKESKGWHG